MLLNWGSAYNERQQDSKGGVDLKKAGKHNVNIQFQKCLENNCKPGGKGVRWRPYLRWSGS